jgi:hypothetical protein
MEELFKIKAVKIKDVSPMVKLFVFGFDNDQKQGRLTDHYFGEKANEFLKERIYARGDASQLESIAGLC